MLKRGVYVAPWIGPNDEVILLVIDRFRHLVGGPVLIPLGASHVRAGDDLWDQLDRADPIPPLKLL